MSVSPAQQSAAERAMSKGATAEAAHERWLQTTGSHVTGSDEAAEVPVRLDDPAWPA